MAPSSTANTSTPPPPSTDDRPGHEGDDARRHSPFAASRPRAPGRRSKGVLVPVNALLDAPTPTKTYGEVPGTTARKVHDKAQNS
ncbi:hypothetical protein [Streptomyces sp. S4.7]|uniref:hypothetical protein n=1 Tax=Streptomyces sp. S4.7 TaxID=2705439 RepID=UPI0013DA9350|nr:hypothetical protein [Streptomyces sp. S4.7]